MSRQDRIYNTLTQQLPLSKLKVEDETYRHHVPKDAESHFKVIAVSAEFRELSRINRHRLVNRLLADEFARGLHALSLHLYTPCEWDKMNEVEKSPVCRDGWRHDHE